MRHLGSPPSPITKALPFWDVGWSLTSIVWGTRHGYSLNFGRIPNVGLTVWLSLGERFTLIQSTLQNLTIYFLHLFSLPTCIISKVRLVLESFLCSNTHGNHKFHITLSMTRHDYSLNFRRSSNFGLTIGQEVHIDSIHPSIVHNILDAYIIPSCAHYFSYPLSFSELPMVRHSWESKILPRWVELYFHPKSTRWMGYSKYKVIWLVLINEVPQVGTTWWSHLEGGYMRKIKKGIFQMA